MRARRLRRDEPRHVERRRQINYRFFMPNKTRRYKPKYYGN